jgi:hypothetical protein
MKNVQILKHNISENYNQNIKPRNTISELQAERTTSGQVTFNAGNSIV